MHWYLLRVSKGKTLYLGSTLNTRIETFGVMSEGSFAIPNIAAFISLKWTNKLPLV